MAKTITQNLRESIETLRTTTINTIIGLIRQDFANIIELNTGILFNHSAGSNYDEYIKRINVDTETVEIDGQCRGYFVRLSELTIDHLLAILEAIESEDFEVFEEEDYEFTDEENKEAHSEGWGIFYTGEQSIHHNLFELQCFDDMPIFQSDTEAIQHVTELAQNGYDVCVKAIMFLAKESPKELHETIKNIIGDGAYQSLINHLDIKIRK